MLFILIKIRFCNTKYSLEEKLSLLEDENHVLRQKALSVSPKRNRPGSAKAFSEVSCMQICSDMDMHAVCLILFGSLLLVFCGIDSSSK